MKNKQITNEYARLNTEATNSLIAEGTRDQQALIDAVLAEVSRDLALTKAEHDTLVVQARNITCSGISVYPDEVRAGQHALRVSWHLDDGIYAYMMASERLKRWVSGEGMSLIDESALQPTAVDNTPQTGKKAKPRAR